MKLGFLGGFFDSNEKEIRRLKPIVEEINALEESVKTLKDKDFPQKTQELKERVANGESFNVVLPQAFALAREAALRTIGQRPFDVQLMAATVLSEGKIAEQKTGEGKTLSAVCALYLNSLSGKSVHLVTVNDYLARRDAGWMGPVFYFLGISIASIINEQQFVFDPDYTDPNPFDFRLAHLRPISRKEAYQKDVVYGINSEFGFDYLRDNMASDVSQIVQRGHFFAIVDEVDSVLIDEARTPHIISAPQEEPSEKYYQYAKLVEKLSSDTDYKIDEKMRTAHLTDHGIVKIEKLFGIPNIYENDFDTVYHLEAALKARTLFQKERDYIVKDNQVILVDEFTGRLMMGRRLSEGLHQALEAKESVSIQRESKTLATVSLQNYFRMYEKLGGMTGTAVTEAEEFHKIYKRDVVAIPTHRNMVRVDHPDFVYKTTRAKFSAVVGAIEEASKKGQPVLVGTTSIEKNETIANFLKRRGVAHQILNAKNHEKEASIIAQAGEKGAVTVATNMAGRGVDIVLGGDSPKYEDGREMRGTRKWEEWEKGHNEVVDLGGLFVIGTERHESRRIDNQLRGRSGRQGDPGMSRFFVSLEDDIMRLFGGETISNLMTRFNMPEDVPLEHALVSRAIEQAQVKVEGFHFDTRKHLVEYDDVSSKQREIIYKRRRELIEGFEEKKEHLKEEIIGKIQDTISKIVSIASEAIHDISFSTNEKIAQDFSVIIPFDDLSRNHLIKQLEQMADFEQKKEFLQKIALDIYNQREKEFGQEAMRELERFAMLSAIDMLWMDHLDALENLRLGIGLRAYGQRMPLVEYKNEAFAMFEMLIQGIDDTIVHRIYKFHMQKPPHAEAPKTMITKPAGRDNSSVSQQQPVKNTKTGRNDPCPCGSGKKYKRCHYPN
ncbi:MAG: preprotein translocase subunit SecA [Candidatus Levybacteria bacterium RIFCSPHIGHO2_01_FULL_42_15]|nr:MAG: preprotein translocase subunit SecA [Candidatus Levybacteria bacterium RIFCSPHIGHO2_01_FULL_42_15]